MKKTIFISSTYNDLKQHRKALWELLEDYKVHINGMEQFGARKDTPLETCLKEVKRSDIYVGIIAHRLGSIESSSGKSYTQLEYEKAIELDKEILIYLIDEKNALVNTEHIDFGAAHDKLENFKQLLKEKHTIDTFKDPKDLKRKLGNRLNDLLKRKERENFVSDYGYSKRILEKFHLFPKNYSENEIKLKLKFKGDGFPASKSVCDTFGFNFGETLGIPIKIIEPEIKGNQVEELFLPEDKSDFYLENKSSDKNLEILGRLIFSENKVKKSQATFFDKSYQVKKPNPNYNPNLPDLGNVSTLTFDNPKYTYETRTIDGDGKAIIIFMKSYQ